MKDKKIIDSVDSEMACAKRRVPYFLFGEWQILGIGVLVLANVYMTLSDETEIVHSQLIEDKGIKKVIVNFERPTDNGFDSARCELPEYKWTEKEGYSDEEIAFFEKLLHSNAHLLYKYAANGGIKIA